MSDAQRVVTWTAASQAEAARRLADLRAKKSFTQHARERGISVSGLRYRMCKMGKTLDEALAMPPLHSKTSARARALGLKPATVKARMRRRHLTAEQALAFKSSLSPRGPNTITQRALAAGLVPATVHRRMVDLGLTLDEALVYKRKMPQPRPDSLTQRALAVGMKPSTVARRMRNRHMTLDEALHTPLDLTRMPKGKALMMVGHTDLTSQNDAGRSTYTEAAGASP